VEGYEYIVIALLLSFMGLLLLGFPIAWTLSGVSLAFATFGILGYEYLGLDTYFLDSWSDYAVIVDRMWSLMENWVLTALPMFVFMGLMLERSGVAESLMTSFVQVFGRFRGGLALAVVMIGILFAASTGIVGASVVLIAVPFTPTYAEYIFLKGRRVLADQMEYLRAHFPRHSPLHARIKRYMS
jgi:TRAP-type mannitol/chloroaromatic compound transport system permease large subunit